MNANKFVVARYRDRWPIGRVREVVASGLSLQEAERIAHHTERSAAEDIVVEDPQKTGMAAQIDEEPGKRD